MDASVIVNAVLVVVTGFYVVLTWRISNDSRTTVKQAQEQRLASVQPLMVPTLELLVIGGDRRRVEIQAPLTNVGVGPALHIEPQLSVESVSYEARVLPGPFSHAAPGVTVGVGDFGDLKGAVKLLFVGEHQALALPAHGRIVVRYENIVERPLATETPFTLERGDDGNWQLRAGPTRVIAAPVEARVRAPERPENAPGGADPTPTPARPWWAFWRR